MAKEDDIMVADYRDRIDYKIGRFIQEVEGVTVSDNGGKEIVGDIDELGVRPIGVLVGERCRHGRFIIKRKIFLGKFRTKDWVNFGEDSVLYFDYYGEGNKGIALDFCLMISEIIKNKIVCNLADKHPKFERRFSD